MNIAFLIQCTAAPVALHAALQGLRLAQAPGWRHHRWFALAALGAALYDGLAAAITAELIPTDLVPRASEVELAMLAVMLVAWARYADAFTGHAPRGVERFGRGLSVVGPFAALLAPGSMYTGPVVERTLLGGLYVYRDATVTPLCVAAAALLIAGLLPTTVRFARAWRRGVPTAGVHLAVMGIVAGMGLVDVLTGVRAIDAPYLLDLGFVLPIAAVASASARRLVGDALALGELRERLDERVREASRTLARTLDDLHDAQRLASLGQLAAGLALEVNEPAAAVASTLQLAADRADPGPNQGEVREAAHEGLAAIDRVVRLTRRLSQVGRLAARPTAGAACDLARVVHRVADEVEARFGGRVRIAVRCPSARVAAPEADLHDLLSAVLTNAAEAHPSGAQGRIEIVLLSAGALELVVDDDGPGIGGEALARAFEPFFTTKAPGQGPGLGLTFARALAERYGGALRLERRPRGGTRAVLTLPEPPPAPAVPGADEPLPPGPDGGEARREATP